MTGKDPARFLPSSIQKSYLMLFKAEHAVLNIALRQYQPGASDSIQSAATRTWVWMELIVEKKDHWLDARC